MAGSLVASLVDQCMGARGGGEFGLEGSRRDGGREVGEEMGTEDGDGRS